MSRLLAVAAALSVQVGCASSGEAPKSPAQTAAVLARPAAPPPAESAKSIGSSSAGDERAVRVPEVATTPVWGQRFYLDDGPGDRPAAELDSIPDAVPVEEPLRPASNQPYTVFGKAYVPLPATSGFRQTGIASWYGKRFHGRPTSSGEIYDMYAMSAAHPTLPIPSYARVTHQASGRSVVVRINDRGPFHPGRVMDLSYAAAHRLGFAGKGSAEVTVEALQPGASPAPESAGSTLASAPPASTSGGVRGPVRPERTAARGNLPPSTTGGELWLQLGAFSKRENAESLRQAVSNRLPDLGPQVAVLDLDGRWRLRVGPLYDHDALDAVRRTLRDAMGIKALPVKP